MIFRLELQTTYLFRAAQTTVNADIQRSPITMLTRLKGNFAWYAIEPAIAMMSMIEETSKAISNVEKV
jgi:hypothetical protein